MRPAIERFEDKYIPEPNSGCWLWIGALFGKRYGNFWDGKKNVLAHRFSYKHYKGEITAQVIDHICRIPCCVNPDHLEQVSQKENVRRGVGNKNKDKTHCINGHIFDMINTYITRRGDRRCKKCATAYYKDYRK